MGQIAGRLCDPDGDGDTADSILDETLIVFLSDNGGKIAQAANNAPLQDDKGSTMEGGIRVPMFLHWPGKVSGDAVFDHPVLALDFYPTFASLAGVAVPTEKVLDGRDFWNDFLAGKNPHPHDPVFWLRHHGAGNEVAIRRGNLKAYRKNFGTWKVFDVANDYGESENVASQSKEVLSGLIADGQAWSKTLIDPQWHDTQAGLDAWNQSEMPRYEETYRIR